MARWVDKVVMGDLHIPYHHEKALISLLRFLRELRPAEVVILGDFLDWKSVARWSRGLPDEFRCSLADEIKGGRKFLADLRKVYDGPVKFLNGNHEDRLRNYLLKHGPALLDLGDEFAVTVGRALDFPTYEVEDVSPRYDGLAPGWTVIHGIKALKHAGMSARAMVEIMGCSVIQGHTHRLAMIPLTTDQVYWGIETGHLSDIWQASYLEIPGLANWQNGFAVIHVSDDGRTVPEVVDIDQGGTFFYQGGLYRPITMTRREVA